MDQTDYIHYFQEFDNITVEHGQVNRGTTINILCGATSGEANNRKTDVTCEECNNMLKTRECNNV